MADPHRELGRSLNGLDALALPGCFIAKSYRGERLADGTHAVTVELNTCLPPGNQPLLTTFHPLASRSPNPAGFAWGDEGSGSAQLAFALLLDALQDVELALRWFAGFHRQVVAHWSGSWSISEQEIRAFIEGQAR